MIQVNIGLILLVDFEQSPHYKTECRIMNRQRDNIRVRVLEMCVWGGGG